MKRLFVFFALASILFGCKTEHQTNTTTEKGLLKTLTANSQEVKVYNSEGILPYLNKDDDKIHVVNFWATWCAPCVKELPHFEQIASEMSDNVEVTLISLDFENDIETKLINFVNKKNLKSDVIVVIPDDEQAFIESVSTNWSGGNIPVTLIYNKHKRYFIEGSVTHDELVAEIEKFKS